MLKSSKIAGSAVLVAGGLMLSTMAASALPTVDTHVLTQVPSQVEQARWVCGPYRCFHRPNYGFYGGPRPWGWHRPWGWRGGWHRGWRRHWHRW